MDGSKQGAVSVTTIIRPYC